MFIKKNKISFIAVCFGAFLISNAEATDLDLTYRPAAAQRQLQNKALYGGQSANTENTALRNMGASGRKNMLEADAQNRNKAEHQGKGNGNGQGQRRGQGRGQKNHS